MTFIQALTLVAVGIVPSLFWLSFYLRKDCHPEPKHLLTTTFLMGIIIAPLALLLQYGMLKISQDASLNYFVENSASFYIWAAFVEEMIKFLAVTLIVLRNPEFDEPVDAMIYMVTAGLGFAAIENVLFMFKVIPDGADVALGVWALRFIGAIFLHALSSSIVGYFLAISWFYQHHKKKLIFIGLAIATLFHSAFNIFLWALDNQLIALLYSTALLLIMAILVAILFDKVRDRHERSKTLVI